MKYRGQRWRILKEFDGRILAVNEESTRLEIKIFPKLIVVK